MGNFDALIEARIPLPDAHDRFKIGNQSDNFSEIRTLTPVFSFAYACLDNGKYSFNSAATNAKDYHKLIKGLKDASSFTYDFMSSNDRFHFHDIKWSDVDISESDFYKCIQNPYKGEKDLTVYQFKVFEEARVLGFIYKSVFYLVMFDRQHKAYDRDRARAKRRRGK